MFDPRWSILVEDKEGGMKRVSSNGHPDIIYDFVASKAVELGHTFSSRATSNENSGIINVQDKNR